MMTNEMDAREDDDRCPSTNEGEQCLKSKGHVQEGDVLHVSPHANWTDED